MYRLFFKSVIQSRRLLPRLTLNTSRHVSVNNVRFFSQETKEKDNDIHCIIKEKEISSGNNETQEFRAETKKLLDIVAKSLYSDKEIFIRELVSNANDALEKLRYLRNTGLQLEDQQTQTPLEIHIKTDEKNRLFIIQDTGVGMTKEEMINNLGTIAKSGSQEFMEKLDESKDASIIGKFGVGFYSSFMVSDHVDVYSRDQKSPSGFHWESKGSDGSFNVADATNVDTGTKIILHLKKDCEEFCDEKVIEDILTKYSSYIVNPIYLNGKQLKMMQPVWLKDADATTEAEHDQFYQHISGDASSHPRYTFSFKTDVPIDIKALFYIPNRRPTLYDISRENDSGVALYSRKVMIMNRTQKLLPSWLRFLKGVVESDDIPLNLSRELLQDSALISKINRVITGKVLRFLTNKAKKETTKYNQFYMDYGLYLKEGIINSFDHSEKESIAKLLRFETNKLPSGELTSLQEYSERMKAGARTIYYLAAPNRQLAESSPYLEAIDKDTEVIFMYEPYDEIVFMQLAKFDGKSLEGVEKELEQDETSTPESAVKEKENESAEGTDVRQKLVEWCEAQLKPSIARARCSNNRLGMNHPCAVSVKDAGAVRYFMRTAYAERSDAEKQALMSATLELNTAHDLTKKLMVLKDTDENLARQLLQQMYELALIQAGLANDSRSMVQPLTDLLTNAFNKIH